MWYLSAVLCAVGSSIEGAPDAHFYLTLFYRSQKKGWRTRTLKCVAGIQGALYTKPCKKREIGLCCFYVRHNFSAFLEFCNDRLFLDYVTEMKTSFSKNIFWNWLASKFVNKIQFSMEFFLRRSRYLFPKACLNPPKLGLGHTFTQRSNMRPETRECISKALNIRLLNASHGEIHFLSHVESKLKLRNNFCTTTQACKEICSTFSCSMLSP